MRVRTTADAINHRTPRRPRASALLLSPGANPVPAPRLGLRRSPATTTPAAVDRCARSTASARPADRAVPDGPSSPCRPTANRFAGGEDQPGSIEECRESALEQQPRPEGRDARPDHRAGASPRGGRPRSSPPSRSAGPGRETDRPPPRPRTPPSRRTCSSSPACASRCAPADHQVDAPDQRNREQQPVLHAQPPTPPTCSSRSASRCSATPGAAPTPPSIRIASYNRQAPRPRPSSR
jgi:hypothetical protein